MNTRAWFGIGLATIGLLAAALSALPLIFDMGQEWSGPVAGAGFAVAFIGMIVGGTSK